MAHALCMVSPGILGATFNVQGPYLRKASKLLSLPSRVPSRVMALVPHACSSATAACASPPASACLCSVVDLLSMSGGVLGMCWMGTWWVR